MKVEEIKTIEHCQYFCEGLLNDLELGILTKEQVLGELGAYTGAIIDMAIKRYSLPKVIAFSNKHDINL